MKVLLVGFAVVRNRGIMPILFEHGTEECSVVDWSDTRWTTCRATGVGNRSLESFESVFRHSHNMAAAKSIGSLVKSSFCQAPIHITSDGRLSLVL